MVLDTKPDYLGSNPRTNMVEKETQLLEFDL